MNVVLEPPTQLVVHDGARRTATMRHRAAAATGAPDA